MIKTIDSQENITFKHFKKLLDKKYRSKTNEFLLEGRRIVTEAINMKANISYIIVNSEVLANEFQDFNFNVILLNEKLFKEISTTVNSQGIIANIKKQAEENSLDLLYKKIKTSENFNLVFLDKIQDPGNLGTIIRSAHAFNIDALVLRKGSAELYSDKVIRSTMGSLFKVMILENMEIDLIEKLKSEGFNLYITDVNKNTNLKEIKFSNKNIIVIGNEGNGVSSEIKEITHEKLNIPMPGNAESLNASVAASIIMYELIR